MTWTYAGNPSSNERDEVRFWIGDTDTTDQQVTDEEIAFLLATRSDVVLAAADAADALAAKYARQVDTTNSKLSVSASKRSAAYQALASTLRAKARDLSLPAPFFGGLTISGKESLASDSDAVQPYFSTGMDDLTSTSTDDVEE